MKKICIFLASFVFVGISFLQAQTVQVVGTVTSAEDGSPIPGASIQAVGAAVGVATDFDGRYSINVPAGSVSLEFRSVGFQSQEVEINGRSVINVVLDPELVALDEVVITALGIRKDKKALGYAVQEISVEDIGRTGNVDLLGAIQGKTAGIDIKPSSGMPGASSQMVIRGSRSLTGDNTPLYVVDGMPISSTPSFSTGNSVTGSDVTNRSIDINPADIESIDVLKGQAAAALYGIRASNGVVIITTKSGKGGAIGKPVVSFSHNSNFAQVSRTPNYQQVYAQGVDGLYNPKASMSWGPKIADLPNDPGYGGNTDNRYTQADGLQEGMYYVPQLAEAGLHPWVKPSVYNNWTDYFQTGYTVSDNLNVSQASENGSFSVGLSHTNQSGIALGTGMERYNAKLNSERKMGDYFNVGFSGNYINSSIDKLSGANDGSLTGVLAAPPSYNLKGIPNHVPGNPYQQIYFRGGTFDNAYWVKDNNSFNEKTDRFFGNTFVNFNTNFSEATMFNVRYQLGVDSYTTHLQDIFGYGSRGNSQGEIDNYGRSNNMLNSLVTASLDWKITDELVFNVMVGNELNDTRIKYYDQNGLNFNFGGWNHISNANTVTSGEDQYHNRTVGFFGNISLSWRSMLYLNATGRNDIVSSMPRNNRSFFYPSVSLGFVVTELEPLQDISWLSFAKLRLSYAEVGQAGNYYEDYYTRPTYGGGFWVSDPITYPIDGVSAYVPSSGKFDPFLKPQNTKSYEGGVDLKFFKNRLGVDYTYSHQKVTDQIFAVPLAGSTGASQLTMNAGAVSIDAHEVMLYATPVKTRDFQWDLSFNYSKIVNMVDSLAPGVGSIFLGGFVTPQVRAGIGYTYPVIYGVSFARDDNGNILVIDNPGAWNHGFPMAGEPAVIGSVSPKFILNGGTTLSYKSVSLSAVVEWKHGGQMYSGSNGLMDLYGVSAVTGDREDTFLFDGYKPDGTPNDIVRGGPLDPYAMQDLYADVLSDIDEYYIHDNSFVKLREVALRYQLPRNFYKSANVGISLYARNVLIWTALRNLDPETSQGNTNMGGSFERFSLPQTTSYGVSIDLTF